MMMVMLARCARAKRFPEHSSDCSSDCLPEGEEGGVKPRSFALGSEDSGEEVASVRSSRSCRKPPPELEEVVDAV